MYAVPFCALFLCVCAFTSWSNHILYVNECVRQDMRSMVSSRRKLGFHFHVILHLKTSFIEWLGVGVAAQVCCQELMWTTKKCCLDLGRDINDSLIFRLIYSVAAFNRWCVHTMECGAPSIHCMQRSLYIRMI